jgi:putative acetyltransferase
MFTLRPYHPDDAAKLLDLFRDTIRRVNARDYSTPQIDAWSSKDIDPADWSRRFAGRYVVVAELSGRPVGFAELEAGGHIDRLYVSADHQGTGIGRALLESLLAEARQRGLPRLFVEASITAQPFFATRGFTTVAPQVVTLRGVEFVNFRMECLLEDDEKNPVRGIAVEE